MAIYIIPLLNALAGWLLIIVAEKILLKSVSVKKNEITKQLVNIIADIISSKAISKQLSDNFTIECLKPTIEKHIDTFLKVKLQEKIPVVTTFMGENTLAKIKNGMMEEVELLLPQLIEQYLANSFSKDQLELLGNNHFFYNYIQNLYLSLSSKILTIKCIVVFTGLVVGFIEIYLLTYSNNI